MSQKYKFNGENEELFFGDGEIYEIIPSKSKVQSEQIDVTEEKTVTLQEEPENQQKKSVILSVFEWLDVVVASVVV